MCSYRIRIKSSKGLCKSIESNAEQVNENLTTIKNIAKENNSFIRTLKRRTISFGKTKEQEVDPKKETKKFTDMYKKEEQRIIDVNQQIYRDYSQMINMILKTANLLDIITFDADSLIYREDKRLSVLIDRLMKQGQNHKIIFKLNMLKGSIKTIALRLFEASKFKQLNVLKYPSPIIKTLDFGDKVRLLAKKLWNLEKTLEKEGTKNIDFLIKEMKLELNYIKRLELDILMMIPGIEKRLIDIDNDLYLLEDSYANSLEKQVDFAKTKIQKIKERITERAQKIFEEIHLIAESK